MVYDLTVGDDDDSYGANIVPTGMDFDSPTPGLYAVCRRTAEEFAGDPEFEDFCKGLDITFCQTFAGDPALFIDPIFRYLGSKESLRTLMCIFWDEACVADIHPANEPDNTVD